MVRLGFISCSFELHMWFVVKITEVALLLAWTPVPQLDIEAGFSVPASAYILGIVIKACGLCFSSAIAS